MSVCVETRSLQGQIKILDSSQRGGFLFLLFLAYKRKRQKMIFPPCVRLLTHFFSSNFLQRQPFPLLTTALLCFCSQNKIPSRNEGRRNQQCCCHCCKEDALHAHINPEPWFDLVSWMVSPDFTEAFSLSLTFSLSCSLIRMWLKVFFFFLLGRFSFKTRLKKCETHFTNFFFWPILTFLYSSSKAPSFFTTSASLLYFLRKCQRRKAASTKPGQLRVKIYLFIFISETSRKS